MDTHRVGPVTERLLHRAFEVRDAGAFYALNSNLEVMRYTAEPLVESIDMARQQIANYADFDDIGFGRWACVLRGTEEVIGFCGLKYLSDLNAVDVGFRFLPQHWGRGFATEACIASLEFGFEILKLRQIIGLVLPGNQASIRVLEKSAMRLEGPFSYDELEVLKYVKDR